MSAPYTLTCLSPVHIGTGEQFGKFDAVYDRGTWHRIELEKVLARGVNAEDLATAMQVPHFSWRKWLHDQRISPGDVAAYQVSCPVDPGETIVRAAMKDVEQQPYLPGSSIKGAMRTAVLWFLLRNSEKDLATAVQYFGHAEALPRKKEWVGQKVERQVLGKTQNQDLLRSLHIRDSEPIDLSALMVGCTWTYTLRNNRLVEKKTPSEEYKIFVEWLMPGTVLPVEIHVDSFLFSEKAANELGFGGNDQVILQLADTCNSYARSLVEAELQFYRQYGPEPAYSFYERVEATLDDLPASAFLLNIGWGGGWEVKTVGDLLSDELGGAWQEIRERYRLGKPRLAAPFPKTRRIAYDQSQPVWPLGWVAIAPGRNNKISMVPTMRQVVPDVTVRQAPRVASPPAKPVNKGQTRHATLKKRDKRWVAIFPGDEREAVITNPSKIPAEAREGQSAEFYIEEANKRIGMRARYVRM